MSKYSPYPTEVRYAGKQGRGVFALRDFEKGEIIEEAPIIIIPNTDLSFGTHLENYLSAFVYNWDANNFVVAGGNGSFLNHSSKANASWKFFRNKENSKLDWRMRYGLRYKAHKKIKKGEEIFINYNGKPDDKQRIWFEHFDGK